MVNIQIELNIPPSVNKNVYVIHFTKLKSHVILWRCNFTVYFYLVTEFYDIRMPCRSEFGACIEAIFHQRLCRFFLSG